MSNKILNRVWKDKTVKSSRDRLALLSLADQANDDGICWPGLKSIEKRMNCSRPTAAKAINQLEHLGAVAVFESHSQFGRRSNHYIVKLGMDEQEYQQALSEIDDKLGKIKPRIPGEHDKPELPEKLKNKDSQGKPILTDPVNPSLSCNGKPILTDPVNPSLHDPLVNPYSINHNRSIVANATLPPPPPMLNTNGTHKANGSHLGKDSPPPSSDAPPSPADVLAAWARLFPNKSQPRESTYKKKIQTRLKSEHFRENWLVAMERAAESPSCQSESWFHFEFFVRNDENYVKCLDRWMSWKDKQIKPANGRTNGIEAEWQAIKIAVGQPGKPAISENALRAVQGVPGGWRRFKEQDARFMDQLKPLFEEAYARTNQQPATA